MRNFRFEATGLIGLAFVLVIAVVIAFLLFATGVGVVYIGHWLDAYFA